MCYDYTLENLKSQMRALLLDAGMTALCSKGLGQDKLSGLSCALTSYVSGKTISWICCKSICDGQDGDESENRFLTTTRVVAYTLLGSVFNGVASNLVPSGVLPYYLDYPIGVLEAKVISSVAVALACGIGGVVYYWYCPMNQDEPGVVEI